MIIPMTDDERRLTEEYLYLVPEMVKKLTSRCAYVSYDEQQDLLQAGNLALCKAAMNYDNTRPFAVYAKLPYESHLSVIGENCKKNENTPVPCMHLPNLNMEPLLVRPKNRTMAGTMYEPGTHL